MSVKNNLVDYLGNDIEDNLCAETDSHGLLCPEDKVKLNSIETGANKTIVDSTLSSTSTNPVQNKVVNTALASKLDIDDYIVGKAATACGNTNNQTIGEQRTAITLNTWIMRNDTSFSFVNGGIKVPYTGNIIISGSVYGTATAESVGCYIAKGTSSDSIGTELLSQFIVGVHGGVSAGTKIISVTAGDIIYLQGRCTSNLRFVPNNAATYLSIMYIQ